jgi:hypothetical protein
MSLLDSDKIEDARQQSQKTERLREIAVEYWGDSWKDVSAEAIERRLLNTLTDRRATPARETNGSLANCEKVSRSTENPELSADSNSGTGVPESLADLDYLPDSVRAIRDARHREDDDRFERVLELVQHGEIAHAKRLANCLRKSAELQCGHCESKDNYVPVTCDSRLCSDCASRKMGKAANQYKSVVKRWDWPTTLRLGLDRRVEPTEEAIAGAVDELRNGFSRLLDRVMPVEGQQGNRRWVWWRDGGEPASCRIKPKLRSVGADDLARRWQKQFVDQGRGIPMREVIEAGLYGIDLKQSTEDGSVNVHMHVLCNCPWLPQGALSQMWEEIAGAPAVDIRRIEKRDHDDAEDALMEVVGYAAKEPEWRNATEAVQYHLALKGSKLVQPFGSLHGNTPPTGGELYCSDCEVSPTEWHYSGIVDGQYDTTGHGNHSRGKDPPE